MEKINIEAALKEQTDRNLDRVNNEKNKAIIRAMSFEEKRAVLTEFSSDMLFAELISKVNGLEVRENAIRDLLMMGVNNENCLL